MIEYGRGYSRKSRFSTKTFTFLDYNLKLYIN